MARLQTLYLPDDGGYAFILDQVSQPDGLPEGYTRGEIEAWGVLVYERWQAFADACGAKAVMATPETITVVDPFDETHDDEPTGETSTRYHVHPVDIEDAPEFVQRIVGHLTGEGPFAHLHGEDTPEPERSKGGCAAEKCCGGGCEADVDAALEQAEQRLLTAIFPGEPVPTEREQPPLPLDLPPVARPTLSDAFDNYAPDPRRCGAANGAGQGCRLPHGHAFLHEFGA